MNTRLFQVIIDILRNKIFYLKDFADKKIELQKNKEIKTAILGSSHAVFYQTEENEFNFGTSSQDLYYSYNLYNKYAKNAKNIILTYSVFSKGLCLIKTKEIELCILAKIIFDIDYQFKQPAYKKKLHLLEPFYKFKINNYFKNPKKYKKKSFQENSLEQLNKPEYIKKRALNHLKNYNRTENQLEFLYKFLEKTTERNQKFYIIIPPATPLYKKVLPDGKKLFEHLYSICKKYTNTKILDFYNSDLFTNDDFTDGDHINEKASVKLTKNIKEKIKILW